MAFLHVQVFGNLRMQYQDRVITSFPTRHVEELWGYLLLEPQTKHHREKLIDLLWPDGAPDNGRARLSTALWRLRTLLEQMGVEASAFLQTSRDWVALVPQRPFTCDLTQFDQALAQADQTVGAAREQWLQTAVALARGDLLDGLYADWVLIAREHLARRYLQALGELMADCLARHAYAEALTHGQVILAADPLREEVHRALMLCYWRLGQPGPAIQQFHHCARLLLDELHILPLPETRALYQQLLDERLPHPAIHATPTIHAAYRDFLRAGDRLNTLLNGD
jgi:DNA-binding SARP family transcriptional activator